MTEALTHHSEEPGPSAEVRCYEIAQSWNRSTALQQELGAL